MEIQTENHVKAVEKEQEQVKELLRRGVVRHYFLGPENIWSREGFGIVVGGALTVLFGGFIFPKLFLYSSNSPVLEKVCWVMTVVGIVLLGKGLYEMLKESRIENKPVSDSVYDEILEHDLRGLRESAKNSLTEKIAWLKDEVFDDSKLLLAKGPRDYSANVNLPLMWRLGEDGKLRYSNFSVVELYFSEKMLCIYTCIFNMRNGTASFPHIYECPYEEIRYAGFEDKDVETVSQNNKALIQNLKMLVIDAGEDERQKLSMPVADYGIMKKLNGVIDISDAEEVVRALTERIKGVKA